ncbi:MAG TPA: hypothetical protein VE093_44685 [Polyangiaceae bacterium]|jgi:hypothetical protein|nr:hypothetical protein [Polyangiaceae bacterium]
MTSQRTLSTPAAILISGVLLAGAVFFGLRSRPSAPSSADDRSASSPRPPTAPAGDARPGPGDVGSDLAPPAPAPGSASRDAATAQVVKAIEAQREAMVEHCWNPSVAKQPTPPSMKLVWNFSFDANGAQIIRGVREDRATMRPNVRQCVEDLLQPIQIPPPGAGVYIEVPFTLP